MEAATGEEKTKTEGGEDGESRGSGAEKGKSKEEEDVACEIKDDNSGTVDMPTISAPINFKKRYSARVSRLGPDTAT